MTRLLSLLSLYARPRSGLGGGRARQRTRLLLEGLEQRALLARLALEPLEVRTMPTAVAVPSGLVSWWTANGTAADVTGLNNATLYGVTYAAGEVGQAFSVDGLDDRAELGDPDSLKLTASMSIDGWILVRAHVPGTQETVLFRGDDRPGLDPYQLTIFGNGLLTFQIGNASNIGASVAAPVPLGQLIHVAATLDDATGSMKLYENGVIVAQGITTIRPFRDLDPAYAPGVGIGNANGSSYNVPLNGLIDELSVYNRALTSGEVLGIYKAGSAGKVFSPIAVDSPSVVDGAGGATTPVTFTMTRTGSLSGSLTVNWTTANDTAVAGRDYVAASGTVIFADSQATQTVQVTTLDNDIPKPNVDFKLILTPAGSTPVMSLATIVNDDAGISINNATVTESNTHFGSLGALVDQPGNGGLNLATGMAFGPDGNLYVGSLNSNEVLRYSASTGTFLGAFVTAGSGGLAGPALEGLSFRPDGNLYVASRDTSSVLRYDATTGAFLDTFVPANSGGLSTIKGMSFGPDGKLYISSGDTNQVLRYDGTTGAFLGAFVTAGSGGLSNPRFLKFGPDGNLYVSSSNTNAVLRYNGTTGRFLNAFIPANSGGLNSPADFLFANGSVYVASQGSYQILRYNATTGAFIEAAVPVNSGGLANPLGLLLDANNNLLVGSNTQILRYGPSSQAAFTVSLISAVGTPASVNYATADGTAMAGRDYVAASGTLTFAPGETVKTIIVPTLDDGLAGPTTSFTVNLSNPTDGVIMSGQGIGTILDDTKFYVVDGGTSASSYQYAGGGAALGNGALGSGDTAPRGVASTAAGTTLWVVDANQTVYVYNTGGALLGSWSAGGLSSSAQLNGIATNGTDIWLLDNFTHKVYDYAGAAGRLSGSQSAASSFSLMSGNNGNNNGKGIVTDGTSFWVVDGSTLKVFKYTLSGSGHASWKIDPANAHPTGITIDPSNVSDIWIVDSGTLKVYQYTAAVLRTSGGQNASATFALAAGDTDPQGIADPPTAAADVADVPNRDVLFALLVRDSHPMPGVSSVDLPAAGALTPLLDRPTTVVDGVWIPASVSDGPKPGGRLDAARLGSRPGFWSEYNAAALLDSTWLDEESQALAIDPR